MDLSLLAGKKVMVTGATGFIGTTLCELLASVGSDIYAVGRSKKSVCPGAATFLQLDLTNQSETMQQFDEHQPDFVIHLAGCVTGKRELEHVWPTLSDNLIGTVNLLTAALSSGVTKTVLAGSLEEPEVNDPMPVPVSPYAASKWAASGYSRMFHALYGLQVVTARIFMVYGPHQKDLTKFVPYVCKSTIEADVPRLMSGERLVDWVYVDDVAQGLARLLLAGPVDGTHVDLGTGRLVTTGDVANMICDLSRQDITPDIGAVPDRKMEQVRKADIDRTQELIGWKPGTSLEKGLAQTFEWYKSNLNSPDRND